MAVIHPGKFPDNIGVRTGYSSFVFIIIDPGGSGKNIDNGRAGALRIADDNDTFFMHISQDVGATYHNGIITECEGNIGHRPGGLGWERAMGFVQPVGPEHRADDIGVVCAGD